MDGWIKSYRSVMDNPIVCKDAEHYAVWGYLLHYASHAVSGACFEGKKIELKPGQLITGRKKIAQKFRINESKVYRVLKAFENEHQIEQRTSSGSTLISILNWSDYQSGEQQIDLQSNNHRTTDEQPLNTIQECKNVKNDNNTHTHLFSGTNKARTREEISPRGRGLLDWMDRNTPSVQLMEFPITPSQADSIVSRMEDEHVMRILTDMCNKGATKRCRSAVNTFNSYASRDFILREKRERQHNAAVNHEARQRGFVKI